MNFTLIGNDKRMDYAAKQLYLLGCEVNRDFDNLPNEACLILSPPVTKDCYFAIKNSLNHIKVIYGGGISSEFRELIGDEIEVYDYLKWEDVIIENSRLTAKGIIKEILSHNIMLKDTNILVTGYGYCGKAISEELKNYDSKVTIAVRKNNLKEEIEGEGYSYLNISSLKTYSNSFGCIINTIPAQIITREIIDTLNSTMIFDIASKPGGVDFEYCKAKNIFAVLSLGIPGKMYPSEAGALIGNACYNHYISRI